MLCILASGQWYKLIDWRVIEGMIQENYKKIKNQFSKIIQNTDISTQSVGLNWHEDFIVNLAKIFKPNVYVELGLYQCHLFNRIIPFSNKLIGVDINESSGKFMKKSDKTYFLNLRTDDYAEELKKNPIEINMLFIDADHSKESVIRDFSNFMPFVIPHGIILLHDTHPKDENQMKPEYCGTAYEAIEELSKQTEEFEMMTIPIAPGLTICRKRKTQLNWKER